MVCYCDSDPGGSGGSAGSSGAAGAGANGGVDESKILPIAPIAQQTPEWCWLASAEMIFRYLDIPAVNGASYQCGIVGALEGPQSICFYNCGQCAFGSGGDAQSAEALQAYPRIVQLNFYPNQSIPQLTAQLTGGPLSRAMVKQVIDNNMPAELGITVGSQFTGMAAHDVVLVGYQISKSGAMSIVVDDPFPYDAVVGAQNNPYRALAAVQLQFGQYSLDYDKAVTGLQWSNSILIQVGPSA